MLHRRLLRAPSTHTPYSIDAYSIFYQHILRTLRRQLMAPPHSQSQSKLRRRRKNKRRRNLLLAVSASFAGAATAITYYGNNFEKNAQHTSRLSGQQWMEELLEGHHRRMKDNLGISAEGFSYLRGLLIEKVGLKSTRYMSATEQLNMLL